MNKQSNKRLIWFAVIVFIIAGAGIGYAAVPQSTVRTTGAGITTYVGQYVNATVGYFMGATNVTPYILNANPAGDANFTSVEADEFFLNSVNKTDIFAYPQEDYTYLVWVDNSTGTPNYYAKSGANGSIVFNGINFVDDVIQPTLNSTLAFGGGMVFVKSGVYDVTATIVLYTNIALVGEAGSRPQFELADGVNDNMIEYIKTAATPIVDWVRIENLVLKGNRGTNILGNGIFIEGTAQTVNDPQIYNVAIFQMAETGLSLDDSWGPRVIGVISEGNGEHGFKLRAQQGYFAHLYAATNVARGIYAIGLGSGNEYVNIHARANEFGFFIFNEVGTTFVNCIAAKNTDSGFKLGGPVSDVSFTGCMAYDDTAAQNYGWFLDGSPGNLIEDISIIGSHTYGNQILGIDVHDEYCVGTLIKNNILEETPAIQDLGTDTKLATLTLSFIDGTTFLSTAPFGWEIDANTEYAVVLGTLPLEVNQVVRWKIYATSVVGEPQMTLQIEGMGGADDEDFATETVAIATLNSTTTNFVATDVIHWTVTASDDADLDDMFGGYQIMIKVLHEAASGGSVETDAIFTCVVIEYG